MMTRRTGITNVDFVLGRTVTVIVPVYRGLVDTQRCLTSVIEARNTCNWRLLVINDCSPEPELVAWLEDFASRHTARVTLLCNDNNLGFVRCVNLGMTHDDTLATDIILLNSDTEVADGWLDRLQAACYRAPSIGTATPWSNNATVFSYPTFPEGGELPAGESTTSMNELCRTWLSGQYVDVPTAHGFCMYIRRDCLADAGLFDAVAFGRGYGEENDFCLRASKKGWRHVHALDVFVFHKGSVSFGAEREERIQGALNVIRQRYPDYEAQIQRFIGLDVCRASRFILDIARIVTRSKTRILFVSHDGGGGTERHQQELVRHLSDRAAFVRLKPYAGGVQWFVADGSSARGYYRLPDEYNDLIRDLKLLGIDHVHYHHWLGYPPIVLGLARDLGVTHDVTIHDYYSLCPQLNLSQDGHHYCGELGLEQCRQCLQRHPAPDGTQNIEVWRQRHEKLLRTARLVIAPTQDVARRVWRYFNVKAHVAGHHQLYLGDNATWPNSRSIGSIPHGPERLRVLVIGALGPIKGADLLEAVATLAAKQAAPVEFHLFGYAYRHLNGLPRAALITHGPYEEDALPELMEWLNPPVVWLPSVCPETYSYTLSAALHGGWPVAATDLGAFAERLDGRPWSWLLPYDTTAEQWLAFFVGLRERYLLNVEGAASSPPPVACSTLDHTFSGPAFDYRRDYVPVARSHPDAAYAIATLSSAKRTHPPQSRGVRLRLRILELLARLRASRLLRGVSARIPLSLQRRTKQWLLR